MITPYYERDGISIYHGSCLDVLPTLERVDHVITDPPYSEYVHSKSRAGSRKLDDTGWLADYSRTVDFGFDPITSQLRSAVASIGAKRWTLVFSDVESAHLWRAELTCDGLDYVRTGAWIKLNCTPQFTGDRPAVGFEAITICHQPGRKRWNGGGHAAAWSHAVVNNRGDDDPRLHPTQKPLSLMRELVSLFTDPGDLILDPFGGSGTTALAAFQLGRRCILVEQEERWCEVTAKRLAAATPPLFIEPAQGAEQIDMQLQDHVRSAP